MTITTRYGKITASMDMLNEISIAYSEASRYRESEGKLATARYYREVSDIIYNELYCKNYYDNVTDTH